MANVDLKRGIAVASACLVLLACSREVPPTAQQAEPSAAEKVYTNKDLEKAAAEAAPQPPEETVPEETRTEPEPAVIPAAPAPVEDRGRITVAENGLYTNRDLAKLPESNPLPPPLPTQGAPDSRPRGETRADAVYTNADLEKASPAPAPESAPPSVAASGPSEAAERKVAEAQARVDELEERLRAVRNPFLPRPKLPPQEEEAWKALDGAERARRVEEQLRQAKEELDRLRSP